VVDVVATVAVGCVVVVDVVVGCELVVALVVDDAVVVGCELVVAVVVDDAVVVGCELVVVVDVAVFDVVVLDVVVLRELDVVVVLVTRSGEMRWRAVRATGLGHFTVTVSLRCPRLTVLWQTRAVWALTRWLGVPCIGAATATETAATDEARIATGRGERRPVMRISSTHRAPRPDRVDMSLDGCWKGVLDTSWTDRPFRTGVRGRRRWPAEAHSRGPARVATRGRAASVGPGAGPAAAHRRDERRFRGWP